MSRRVGFVVVEIPQMGTAPELPTGADIHDVIEDAIVERDDERARVAAVGRTDQFHIGVVELLDDAEIKEEIADDR